MKQHPFFTCCKLFFLVFCILGIQHQTWATHAVGADLTYTCLGGNTYEVTLRFYRDCGGVAAPSNPSISISGSSSCASVTSSVNLSLVSSQEVSQVCAGAQTSCAGGSIQGTQEYVYRGQVQLPAGCDSYTISFTECDRNSSITNIQSNNTCIYIETVINTNLAPCNNSPQFNNLPVLYSCQAQLSQFNHGFYDTDGDSLSFTLVNPKTTGGANIPFVSGLSATTPLRLATGTTFQFNSANGQMTFTPAANTGQVAVISVLIEEFRNGQKIGSMIRDLQMIVSASCTSVPPVAGSITPSSGTVNGNLIASCGGPPLVIDFSVSDPDVADILTASSDISTVITGATTAVTGTNPINIRLTIPTASLPSGNYPFTITVNDGSCPNPNIQIIGYNLQITNPSPVVTVNASATTVCLGDPITLTAAGASTYSWDNGITNGMAFTPTSSGSYTVIGTATNGCTDTTSITIQVDPVPTVQINASHTTICQGDSITLSGQGAITYTWNNAVVDGQTFAPNASNTYVVTGTDGNGCSNTDQVMVVVNTLPLVVANASETILCQGEMLTLTGTGATTYQWDNGVVNGVAFSPSSNATYSVTGTDGNGCSNTDQVTVNYVNTAPPIASISAAAVQICQGTSTLLTGAVDVANGETIAWYYNGQLIVGATAATYTATQAGSYYNIVTNNSGCTSESSTVAITYYTQPQAAFSTSAANFCGGTGTITLTTPTVAGITYAWLNNSAPIVGETQSSLTISNPGNYQLVLTSSDGCIDTSSIFSPINASIPQVSLTAPDSTYCSGSTLTLTANLETGATYEWFLNGNSITTPAIENNSINISTAGTYHVEVTNTDGCMGSSNIFAVTEKPLPMATIAAAANSFCQGSSLDLVANFVAGATYEWFLNGNSLGGASLEDTIWSATTGGNYTVVINDGCENSSNVLNLTTVSAPAAAGSITGSDDLCYGERERYSISTVSGATYYRWSITPASAATISAGQGTYEVTINTTNSNFQIEVAPVNGCGVGAIASKNVTMNNGFFCPDVAFAGNNTNICEGESVTFTNYSNSNIGFGLTQQWNFGAGASPATATGSGPHTVTYSTAGLKDVTLEYVGQFGTAFYSETYTDYVRVTSLANCGVAVQPVEDIKAIECYPNPTTGDLWITFGDPTTATLEVLSIQGKVLTTKVIEQETQLNLSLKDYPTGLYWIAVQSQDARTILKVVKND